jgi:hypothetical protein
MLNNILSMVVQKSDDELLSDVAALAGSERELTAAVIAHVAEIDARKLYLGQGFPSLFHYCVQILRLSPDAAYNRIEVARVVRRFPAILELLADGSIHVTAARLLAPHLTAENHRSVLESAKGKTTKEVAEIVARLAPRPDVPTSIRRLPAPKPEAPTVLPVQTAIPPGVVPIPTPPISPPPPRPACVEPLAPERFKLQLTVSGETVEKLRLAQDMLRHAIPAGDEGAIIDRALTLLVEDLARRKFADTDRPRPPRDARPDSRYIPAAVKRAVWLRDLGRCAFVGANGRRCGSRALLEFDHVVPFAAGGETTVANLRLACAMHNRYASELYFGPRKASGDGGMVRESQEPYGTPAATCFKTSCFETVGSSGVPPP